MSWPCGRGPPLPSPPPARGRHHYRTLHHRIAADYYFLQHHRWATGQQHDWRQHHCSFFSHPQTGGAKKDSPSIPAPGGIPFGGHPPPHHQHHDDRHHVLHQQQQMQGEEEEGHHQQGEGGALVSSTASSSDAKSKEEEESLWSTVEAQAAFLGPNLWDRTLPYDTDLKYVDLDEFLSENGIPVEGGEHQAPVVHQPTTEQQQPAPQSAPEGGRRRAPSRSPRPESYDGGDERHYPSPQEVVKLEQQQPRRMLRCSPQPTPATIPSSADPDTLLLSGCAPGPPSPAGSDFSVSSSTTTTTGHDFDPRTRAFSDEELKPQPMIKKSKKQFVPDDLKDEKYWARRRKNNMAAKRSRDARRVKENQIALRAGFLEKENVNLRQELERLKKENSILRERLTKYTEV